MNINNTQTSSVEEKRSSILLVEDDLRLSAFIKEYLEQHEFNVELVHRGDDAVDLILQQTHNLVVLDLMLPGVDGLEVCRQVRQQYRFPILMLTALDDSVEQVVGLEIGADDYVIKPVEPRVLLAKIRALLRHANRTEEPDSEPLSDLNVGQLSMNQRTRAVVWKEQQVDCTEVEFTMLWLLASNAGQVLSRDTLFETLVGYPYDGLDRSVDILRGI